MDAVSYSLASKQAQRIEKFIENPDSTSGIVTVPKTIASGETVTVPAGRVAVLPNVVVDGTLNIDGEVFIPSGSSVDFSNGIKIDGNNIALSIPTSYHLLQGNLSATINANYVEVSATTTRNYTTSDYIFDSLNNKLYDCILASTSGSLLTNTTYFTLITAGALQLNIALVPFANGIDSNGSKNTIVYKNETITGLTLTAGKNYVYCDKNGSYGATPHKPRYLESELVRTYAGEQPDYFSIDSNKWFNTDSGSELVTNGTFSSGVTTGWIADGSNILSVSNGIMLVSRNNSTASGAKQTITTDIGKKYTIRFKVTSLANSGTPLLYIGSTANGAELGIYSNTTTGIFEYSFIAQSTSTYLQFGVTTSGTGIVGYDDISVFPTDITPTTEITESRNYLNHIVHADQNGQVIYVEELTKIEYKNVIKANEFKGKNACTAWVNFDGTTTPPTIRDSYNISAIIRIGAGQYEAYFKEDMNNDKYSNVATQGYQGSIDIAGKYINKVYIVTRDAAFSAVNDINISIQIFGGRD